MRVLLVRHDASGMSSWKEYDWFSPEGGEMIRDLMAHLNTAGVSRLEVICEGE